MAQTNWRWCINCEGLHFGEGRGRCTGPESGDRHTGVWASGLYVLFVEGEAPGQPGWRWCARCQGLWFAGNRTNGRCFAGGEHTSVGSWSYVVPLEGQAAGQPGWRWCPKCQGLWFTYDWWSPRAWCPAGGSHEAAGFNYVVMALPGERAWFDAARGTSETFGGVGRWIDGREDWSFASSYRVEASTTNSLLWPVRSHPGRPAVRFGDDLGQRRKGLEIGGDDFTGIWETPYTAVVVVQRTSARGDNYPLASVGIDCSVFGCMEDSVLHLGWRSDRTIRFGQWADDVDLLEVPAYRPDREVVSIICAVSDGLRKLVTLDEPGFSRVSAPRHDGRLLRGGRRALSIGGPPWDRGPDFHFNGHVFEVRLWTHGLTPHQLDVHRAVLRQHYGVGGVAMTPTPR